MQFKVEGMTCAHCVRAVESAVRAVAPNAAPSVDLASGLLRVSGQADPGQVVQAITDEGYQAHALAE